MANESESRFAVTTRELFSLEFYKRNQGRLMRSLTVAGISLFLLWGLKSLSDQLVALNKPPAVAYGVPVALLLISGWMLFRLYNWPRFADFLIATEAEMTKVSWSSKEELKRATLVVLVTLFLLAGFLFSVDLLWSTFLEQIGVLQKPAKKAVTAAPFDAKPLRHVTLMDEAGLGRSAEKLTLTRSVSEGSMESTAATMPPGV
jgi:preprotein translocase subunit SecE